MPSPAEMTVVVSLRNMSLSRLNEAGSWVTTKGSIGIAMSSRRYANSILFAEKHKRRLARDCGASLEDGWIRKRNAFSISRWQRDLSSP